MTPPTITTQLDQLNERAAMLMSQQIEHTKAVQALARDVAALGSLVANGDKLMPQTKVIHKRNAPDTWQDDPQFVYIGRAMPRQRLKASPFANPFKIDRDGDRDEVVRKYRTHLLSQPDLLAQLKTLQGKTLVCWCSPEACHGDVIVEMLAE